MGGRWVGLALTLLPAAPALQRRWWLRRTLCGFRGQAQLTLQVRATWLHLHVAACYMRWSMPVDAAATAATSAAVQGSHSHPRTLPSTPMKTKRVAAMHSASTALGLTPQSNFMARAGGRQVVLARRKVEECIEGGADNNAIKEDWSSTPCHWQLQGSCSAAF